MDGWPSPGREKSCAGDSWDAFAFQSWALVETPCVFVAHVIRGVKIFPFQLHSRRNATSMYENSGGGVLQLVDTRNEAKKTFS